MQTTFRVKNPLTSFKTTQQSYISNHVSKTDESETMVKRKGKNVEGDDRI